MEPQSFYINRDYIKHTKISDQYTNSVPIRINCTGYGKLERPFVTNGERLDWYVQIVDEGAMKSECGDVNECQFIVWPPERNHRYEKNDNNPFSYYWVHFTGSYAEQLLKENGIEPLKVYTVSSELMKTIRREWGDLFREYMLKRPGYEIMVAAHLVSIIVRLGRQVKKNELSDVESEIRKRLENTVSYIHNHYTEDVSVKTLAENEHMSQSRFRELFKKAFGTSPGDYIINLRIERAGELLITTDSSVSYISSVCGYDDEFYFSRIFKKKTGYSPLMYRREYHPSRKL